MRTRARAISPMIRLALLGTAIVVASSMLLITAPDAPENWSPAPWWAVVLVAIGVVIAQHVVFHVEFRLDAATVSLIEVPAAFALVYLDLRIAVVVIVVAEIGALLIRRPPALHKTIFNACVFLADIALAAFVFRTMLVAFGDSSTWTVVAVVVSMSLMAGNGAVWVCAAISLFDGGFLRRVSESMRAQLWAFPLSGLLAGLTLTPALLSPWLIPLSVVPIAAIWWLVREHASLRRRFVDLEATHGFAGEIADVVDLQQMIDVAIEGAARILHARQAALVLFDRGAIVGTAIHGEPIAGLPTTGEGHGWPAAVRDARGRGAAVQRDDGSLEAIVRGDGGELGLLVVNGREGASAVFDLADARRLQALADQLAAGVGRGLLHRRLEFEARHDLLTGLPNRSTFEAAIDDRCNGRQQPGELFVVMFDLDRFKEVNDTLGHHAGDQVLVEFASRLSALLQPDDVLARFAGDEFAFLGRRANADSIDQFVRTCTDATSRPFALDGLEVVVTVSAGVALLTSQDDPSVLVRRADVAMYHAKSRHLGHDFHREEIDRRTPARLSMLTDLRTAIQGEEIQLHFQPKLDLASNRVDGVEALARWHHPTRGWVSPVDFITVAEESGLIRSLTDHVVARGVAALAQLHALGHDVGLAVNLSTQDLFDELLGDRIERRLEQYGLAPEKLTVEITEGSLLVDGPRTRATIDRLHRIGVHLSIDDFGTGYSSLAYLRMLPVSELKIDRSFVTELLTEQQDEVIVRSTIDLGHNLGMRVVAEGVEDLRVAHRLGELTCDIVQGFGIARPMPLEQLVSWLGARRETEIGVATSIATSQAVTPVEAPRG